MNEASRRSPKDPAPKKDGSTLSGLALVAGISLVGAGVGWLLLHGIGFAPTPAPPPSRGSASVEDNIPPPAIDPNCTDNGCLRSVKPLTAVTKEELQKSQLESDNGYTVFTIQYFSSGATLTATVTIPSDAAPEGGFHVVSNAHGMFGLDDHCWDEDRRAKHAAYFGAHGLVGVAFDYPKIGTSTTHEYLVSDVEGHAVLDALRAARNLARREKAPLSGRFAAAGAGLGGHATLAAAAIQKAYAADVDMRAYAVVAPNPSWEEQYRAALRDQGPSVSYTAATLYAWSETYRYDGPSIWSVKAAPNIAKTMKEICLGGDENTLAPALSSAPDTFSPAFLTAYRSGNWGPYSAILDYFKKNRIGPYSQAAPLKIYQGSRDSEVPKAWTDELVAALRAGGVAVDYETVSDAGNTDVAFGPLSSGSRRSKQSIVWLKAQLNQ